MLIVIWIFSIIRISQAMKVVSAEISGNGPLYEVHCKLFHRNPHYHDLLKNFLVRKQQFGLVNDQIDPLKKLFQPIKRMCGNNSNPFSVTPAHRFSSKVNVQTKYHGNKNNKKGNATRNDGRRGWTIPANTRFQNSTSSGNKSDTTNYPKQKSTPKSEIKLYENDGRKIVPYVQNIITKKSVEVPINHKSTEYPKKHGQIFEEIINNPYAKNFDEYTNSVYNPKDGAQFHDDIFPGDHKFAPFGPTKLYADNYDGRFKYYEDISKYYLKNGPKNGKHHFDYIKVFEKLKRAAKKNSKYYEKLPIKISKRASPNGGQYYEDTTKNPTDGGKHGGQYVPSIQKIIAKKQTSENNRNYKSNDSINEADNFIDIDDPSGAIMKSIPPKDIYQHYKYLDYDFDEHLVPKIGVKMNPSMKNMAVYRFKRYKKQRRYGPKKIKLLKMLKLKRKSHKNLYVNTKRT